MDRQVAIIRGWLLIIGVATLTVVVPTAGLALWPILFLLRCCCATGPMCSTNCSPAYGGNYQVVVTGTANGTCTGCTALDGTYEVVRNLTGNTCQCVFLFGSSVTCVPALANQNGAVVVDENTLAGNMTHTCFVTYIGGISGGSINRFRHDHGTTTSDCAAVSGLNLPLIFDDSTGRCVFAGTTVVITAIP